MLVLSYLEQETRVMTLKDSLAIVPIVLGLAACDVATYRPNETTGALTGAIVGGVVCD